MTQPTYVVLYNRDDNIVGGEERDVIAAQGNLEALAAITRALATLGRVETLETGDGDPERLARSLRALAPRAVFNLAEAVRGLPALEPTIPSLLELLGIPYTGSPPLTLGLCLDKPRSKALLAGRGIATPGWRVVANPARDPIDGLRYPLIVKPAAMDASHGIDSESVVHDEASARRRAAWVIERYGPRAIVEEFIDGREFNVTVADDPPTVFPLAEIDWQLPPGMARVCGFEAKWVEGSIPFEQTPIECPANVDAGLEARIKDTALRAFHALGARDYARVDMRVDDEGKPWVLEVNPNPDISEVAGVARSADVAGWSYDDFIRRIIKLAEKRGARAQIHQTQRS